MGAVRRPEVTRLSARVALNATLLVGLVYLAVAVTVVVYVTGSLTTQVDQRLSRALDRAAEEALWPPGDEPIPPPPGDRPLGPERAMWTIALDGTVTSDQPDLVLPAEYQTATEPTTIVIDGLELRIAGAAIGDNLVVVGESLDPVNDARTTVILGELLIAPILLLAVFLGALMIGRRVAMPIERARRRQLDFTADASHELRTPLSVIEANTSLALAHDRDASWYRRSFEKVDAEAKRMRGILDDLLWLARFDAAQRPANVEPVDLGVLAVQATDRFAPVAQARGLSLSVSANPMGAVVVAPSEWLDRLMAVLLDNACKFSPDGGTVQVTVTTESGRVVMSVDDSGPGISDDERQRIFDRFHRGSDGRHGAGLGLAIADAIVRATDGRWQVSRAPAGGARMSVTWPEGGAGDGRESAGRTARADSD